MQEVKEAIKALKACGKSMVSNESESSQQKIPKQDNGFAIINSDCKSADSNLQPSTTLQDLQSCNNAQQQSNASCTSLQ